MFLNGLRYFLWFALIDVTLFVIYCMVALWLPVSRLVRRLQNPKKIA